MESHSIRSVQVSPEEERNALRELARNVLPEQDRRACTEHSPDDFFSILQTVKTKLKQERATTKTKVLICMDDFKGSISSEGAGEAVAKQLTNMYGDAIAVHTLCLSDGGDGFLQVLQKPFDLDFITTEVTGPSGDRISSYYGYSKKVKGLAVVEMALASGLSKLKDGDKAPLLATTYGTGELIKAAQEKGANRIIVGHGGSATTDGGLGALQAMGLKVIYGEGIDTKSKACGGLLEKVKELRMPEGRTSLLAEGTELQLAVDVKNPFTGPSGAVAVFSKQKGANFTQQIALEQGMSNIAAHYERLSGVNVQHAEGAGAAGGLSGGLMALCGAKVKQGMELIDEAIGLSEAIRSSDLVITGEGCYDTQTMGGKAVSYVEKVAESAGVPVVIICGKKIDIPDHIYELTSLYNARDSMRSPRQCIRGLVSIKAHEFPVLSSVVPFFAKES